MRQPINNTELEKVNGGVRQFEPIGVDDSDREWRTMDVNDRILERKLPDEHYYDTIGPLEPRFEPLEPLSPVWPIEIKERR